MSSQFNHIAKLALLFHFSATFIEENNYTHINYCNFAAVKVRQTN